MEHNTRLALWAEWQKALQDIANCEYPDTIQAKALAESLGDIRLRDALLADMAHRPDMAGAFGAILSRLTVAAPESAPAYTMAGALEYLRSDLTTARAYVGQALDIDSGYSLAGLLSYGLLSEAAPSLLRRSFTTWEPVQLLEGSAV